jgi:ubiquitin-conjugating enzyme E2 Q
MSGLAPAPHAVPPAVELEVLLDTQNFPFAPPFVRVVRPVFAFHTGHITIGGSICMEILTSSGWSCAIAMESVFVSIRAEVASGGARLDPRRFGEAYSESEARAAFKRVAMQHGWER